MVASQSSKSTTAIELQTRIDQLAEQLTAMELDKRKFTQEKDDLQQELMKQKDRTLEAERDAGF